MQYIEAPVNGWNPDAPPHELPGTEAVVLDNFLIRPGKIVCRGGFSKFADTTTILSGAPANICGVQPVAVTGFVLVLTQKVISATAYIDPWNAPLLRPASAASLAAPGTKPLYISNAGVISQPATVADGGGFRSLDFDGTEYYISYGTLTAPVHDTSGTYFAQSTVLSTPTGGPLTGAPLGGLDLKGYLSRIWMLGGVDVPGSVTTFSPTTIFFTNPIAGGGGAAADWQDPVSGLTNKLRMDDNSYDPGVALATVTNGLVVFRYSSVWFLKGTTTANFILSPINKEVGCVDARSVVETAAGAYFLSHQGLMETNGSVVKNMSGSVMYTLQNAIGIYIASKLNGFGGHASCALTSTGQIVVSIGIADTTAGAPNGHIKPVWCGMYDPSTGAWVRLTSPLWAADATIAVTGNAYPGLVVSAPQHKLYTIGDNFVVKMEDLSGGISFLQNPGLYDDMGSGTLEPIPAVWKTRLATLAFAARKSAQVKRMFMDYAFQGSGILAANGWTLTPMDASGNTYNTPLATPILTTQQPSSVSGGVDIGSPVVQHINSDLLVSEMQDLGFEIAWTDINRAAQPTQLVPEIYGVGVEFQPTGDLR